MKEVDDWLELPDMDTCCICLKTLPKERMKKRDGSIVLIISPDQVTRVCSLLYRHSNEDCSPGGRLYKKHFERFRHFAKMAKGLTQPPSEQSRQRPRLIRREIQEDNSNNVPEIIERRRVCLKRK